MALPVAPQCRGSAMDLHIVRNTIQTNNTIQTRSDRPIAPLWLNSLSQKFLATKILLRQEKMLNQIYVATKFDL